MRSDGRLDLFAGNKFTGKLTSPKVSVPDQNGRTLAGSSADSTLFVALLGSAFLLLQRLQTLGKHTVERGRLAFCFYCAQLRRVALRLALDEFHHPLAIFVFKLC